MQTQIGPVQEHYSARGLLLHYYVHMVHPGLNKSRTVKASSPEIVKVFAELQASEWNQKWAEVEAKQAVKNEKDAWRELVKDSQKESKDRTEEAQNKLNELTSLIQATLSVNDALDWDLLKNSLEFPEPQPKLKQKPTKPKLEDVGREPLITDKDFQPQIGIFDKLFGGKKAKEEQAQIAYELVLSGYNKSKKEAEEQYKQALSEYEKIIESNNQEFVVKLAEWKSREADYLALAQVQNELIDAQKQKYLSGDHDAVVDYNEMVLSHSDYPECFLKEFDLDYLPETKTLIVDYRLPYIDDLPTLKEVKFIQSRQEFQEKHISASELNKLFDEVIYQTTLRTVHEIFEADVVGAIDSVVFNGIVNYIDKSSGHDTSACIVSLQTVKDEFLGINLAHVEAKACFKNLKGVGSSKLHGMSPIAPIMNMRKDDGRFVSAQEVVNTLDDSTNLAAMDWQEFEHLIRELFEKEFSSNGGEVKITQASRDGGVDAVAFDPDPIRGGKIVIQAKRYTNTVTVSAVRDLYGTVMNEGATKGILVTTSDYGPDAYSFAKDKPLTLLNGGHLLFLLEKHGHKARIDIKEAKLLNG
jgi:restriction system protein